MEEECEIVAEVEKPSKTSPSTRKLKQSRLSFMMKSSQAVSPLTQKKRKLSVERNGSSKTPRNENLLPEKEAVLKTKKNNDTKLKQTKPGLKKRGRPPLKENVVKEKRKRGRPKKTSPRPSAGKNKKVDASSLLSDDEVSSSVDDESELPRAKKKNLETTRKLLGGLYCEPTQEAKISTSTAAEDQENSEEEDDEEMPTSSKHGLLKSLDKEGGDKEGESPSKKSGKWKSLKNMELVDLKLSSSEEEEDEEELEISRKKETEEKDSTSSNEEDSEGKVKADNNRKQTMKKKDSSDVERNDNLEKKSKVGLPSEKKGSSDEKKSYPKKTDTKADTKRDGKKRARKGIEESMRVKKSKLDREEVATCDNNGLEEEKEDIGSPREEDDGGIVREEEEDKEDYRVEEKSDQGKETDVRQKEVTQQDEIAKDLDNTDESEIRDLEEDETESEKENNEDKSIAQNSGSVNKETEEGETDMLAPESLTSIPGTEKKVKPACESDGRKETPSGSKREKKMSPKGDKTENGKQAGIKEDGNSIDATEKSKHDGINTRECVVSITRFFSPITKSEGSRRKSLGNGKKNQEDNKKKEASDNAEEKQGKERKDKDNEGEWAGEKEIMESGIEDKKQPIDREAEDGEGSEKPVQEKEVTTDDDGSKQKKMNDTEEDGEQMDESTSKESGNMCLSPSTSKSPTTIMNSKALTPMTAAGPPKKKLTPKQRAREEELQRKRLEREKKKQEEQAEKERKRKEELAEKEKKRKEKEEERIKVKEEKEKMKEEQKKKKQEELDAKRQIKEEEKQRKEEEKQRKEEEKQRKEEEKLKKEEEKLKKEEAKKQAEEEKNKQKEKLKNKFASFFVSKRREVEDEEDEDSGLFKQFRIKEDMRLAPLHRSQLTADQTAKLELYLSNPDKEPSTSTYLETLRTKEYVKGSSQRTWPRKKAKDVENDVEVIEEEDDEEEYPGEAALNGAVLQDLDNVALPMGSRGRAKLLYFCDNRRPAYWGTWSKKSVAVSGRRPFAKETIFDYEYDSDDDWEEEEETGESLSDSEGEDKEEEEDQYEVDNDFFVPHGYLSDDEAVTDQEEEMEQEKDEVPQVDGGRNLKLKQKQAEFDKEMKRKTKELKPRLIGCLWLADKNNNPAYHQLLKVLNPYKAVALCPLPIDTRVTGPVWVGRELEEKDQEEDGGGTTEDKKHRFYRMFPEEAVPSLIRLLHGNRNGKGFLTNEFRDYHRKQCEKEEVQFIARKKVEMKLKELGRWCKCPDQGPMHNVMMWYVPKETRQKYGLEDLTLPNTWTYINTPKTHDDTQQHQTASTEDAGKTPKNQPITAFTKKITPGTSHSPSLPTTPIRDRKQELRTPKNLSITSFTKKITPGASPSSTITSAATPSPSRVASSSPSTSASTTTPQAKSSAYSSPRNNQASESSPSVSREQKSGNKPGRKRRSLTNSQGATPPKTSIVSFFKKGNNKGESLPNTKSPITVGSSSQEEMDCVTID